MEPTPKQRQALIKAISPDRLGTYTTVAKRMNCDVLDLYLWDRDLAAAAIADIAVLEVATRNAISESLHQHAGREDWYAADLGLDNRSLKAINLAWEQVPQSTRTPGRVVARLMFGFWRGLLESGDALGEGPRRITADYEKLWRSATHKAFLGGKAIATSEGTQFTRTWTLAVVKEVHALRNRAAHHEPLVNGFPMPGEKRRLLSPEGHTSCLKLAALLDRDLASWLTDNSHMGQVLQAHPAPAPTPTAT